MSKQDNLRQVERTYKAFVDADPPLLSFFIDDVCSVCATGRVVKARWVQIFDFREGLVCRHRE
jgi:hypothetical protein